MYTTNDELIEEMKAAKYAIEYYNNMAASDYYDGTPINPDAYERLQITTLDEKFPEYGFLEAYDAGVPALDILA